MALVAEGPGARDVIELHTVPVEVMGHRQRRCIPLSRDSPVVARQTLIGARIDLVLFNRVRDQRRLLAIVSRRAPLLAFPFELRPKSVGRIDGLKPQSLHFCLLRLGIAAESNSADTCTETYELQSP